MGLKPPDGTPRVPYTTKAVIQFVGDAIVRFPSVQHVAAKAIESLQENALVSADSLDLLRNMLKNEEAGMAPMDALKAAREENKNA